MSTTSSTVGFNTITITGGASLTPDNFIFSRKDAVHQQQIINYIKPEIQDSEFSYFDGNVNSSIDLTQSVIESAEYFMSKKYRGDKDTNVDDEIKFEGSVVINDPNNYNSTSDKVLGNTPVRRSPGVYIGDTRAFSSDNNPWDKVGTALTTSSEEVSIGELAFLDGTNSMIITGIDNDVSTVSGEVATSFTHKIPVSYTHLTLPTSG